jgi:protein-L-isoaspartate O-methyltransferase
MADDTGARLAWTGERFVPGEGGAVIAYEHVHRYAAVAQLARGRDVVDLGCGEGYGAAHLARTARSVVGIDIDEATVAHAERAYGSSVCHFLVGDLRRSGLADGCADLVVCFEALEHVREGDHAVAQARRLLRPGGLFVVSTPDKDASAERRSEPNPFHLYEYRVEEFRALLLPRFEWVQLWAQKSTAGSVIWAVDGAGASAAFIALQGSATVEWAPSACDYAIAICGTGPAPPAARLPSVLLDPAAGLLREHDGLYRAYQGLMSRCRAEVEDLRERLAGSEADGVSLRKEVVGLRELLAGSEANAISLREEVVGLRELLAGSEADGVLLRENLADAIGEIGRLREGDEGSTTPEGA